MRSKWHSIRAAAIALGAVLVGTAAAAQSADGQQIVVPLSDPSRPAVLQAEVLNGSLSVSAYEGNEIIVRAALRTDEDESSPEKQNGLTRIPNTNVGLSIEEHDNRVTIDGDWSSNSTDLVIQVPRHTSLKLGTVNGGDIRVEGVDGNHELENVNGAISALDVAGSVVASTTNGDVTVRLTSVEPDKPMALSTWNGDVDLTLPAATRAKLRLDSGQGEIYTDFDLALEPQSTKVSRQEGKKGYKVRIEQEVVGRINSGETEFRLKTYNGDIFVRRAPAS